MKQQYKEVGKNIGDGWHQRGFAGAVGSAVSSVPATLVKPVVLAAKASKNALDGARNTIKPKGSEIFFCAFLIDLLSDARRPGQV